MNTSTETGAPVLRPLPLGYASVTHRFEIAGHVGYITVGLYEDGLPGMVCIATPRENATVRDLLTCFSTLMSEEMQAGHGLHAQGARLHALFGDIEDHVKQNHDVHLVQQTVEYSLRWLMRNFLLPDGRRKMLEIARSAQLAELESPGALESDAPPCSTCGSVMTRSGGACYMCRNCGSTTGCSM